MGLHWEGGSLQTVFSLQRSTQCCSWRKELWIPACPQQARGGEGRGGWVVGELNTQSRGWEQGAHDHCPEVKVLTVCYFLEELQEGCGWK